MTGLELATLIYLSTSLLGHLVGLLGPELAVLLTMTSLERKLLPGMTAWRDRLADPESDDPMRGAIREKYTVNIAKTVDGLAESLGERKRALERFWNRAGALLRTVGAAAALVVFLVSL